MIDLNVRVSMGTRYSRIDSFRNRFECHGQKVNPSYPVEHMEVDVICQPDTVLVPSDMLAISDYDPFMDDDGDGDLHPDWLYSLTFSGKRHNGIAVAAFCDAHVEYAKTNRWLAKTDAARRRWNNDHLPH